MNIEAPGGDASISPIQGVHNSSGDGDEIIICEECDNGVRDPGLKRGPAEPTPLEIAIHNITHLPYRAWCRHCVRGRGRSEAHQRMLRERDNALPTVVMDYCFMGSADDGSVLPILVIRDYSSGKLHCTVVPRKGSDQWVVLDMCNFLDSLGYKRIILKTDQENAIKDLKVAIKTAWRGELIIEHSPVADSQANGVAERAVQSAEGQVRVLKDALEWRLGCALSTTSPVLTWLVRHAGLLVTRFEVGIDGRTAHERNTGKRATGPRIEFGESVLFKLQYHTRTNKMDVDWFDGVYLGVWGVSGEHILGTNKGVVKARSIQRLPLMQRRNQSAVQAVVGTPWNTAAALEAGDVQPEVLRAGPLLDEDIPAVAAREEDRQVRRGKITKSDLRAHGWTAGCPGCEQARRGLTPPRNHSEECRKRFQSTADGVRKHKEFEERKRKHEGDDANDYGDGEGDDDMIDVDAFKSFRERMQKRMPGPMSGPVSQPITYQAGGSSSSASGAAQSHQVHTTSTAQLPQSDRMDVADQVAGKRGRGEAESEEQRAEAEEDRIRDVEHLGVLRRELNSFSLSEHRDLRILERETWDGVVRTMGIMGVDVSELYSPPRVTAGASFHGLNPGTAFDIQNGYDFNNERDRVRAERIIDCEKPMLLIGSPMCTAFSRLQYMNWDKWDLNEITAWLEQAISHLEFCCYLYNKQADAGRYFLHEHPAGATSWSLPCVQEVLARQGVEKVIGHMCTFGMESADACGPGLVYKPTGFMSNARLVLDRLERKCENARHRARGEGELCHRHVELTNNRAKQAAVYPPGLVNAILEGLKDQLATRVGVSLSAFAQGGEQTWEQEKDVHEWVEPHPAVWDDLSGLPLDAGLVKEARAEELREFGKLDVWDIVPLSECWDRTGKGPIGTRWVDVNKGDRSHPDYRSRLVAQELKKNNPEVEMFAAMPPLELKKALFSMAVSAGHKSGRPYKLGFIDVKKAYLYAKSTREVYVRLPDEMGMEGMCARLKKSLYGTRDAAQNWEAEYTSLLLSLGFTQGRASPCAFWHEERDVRCVVHGDDFTVLSDQTGIEWLRDKMAGAYQIKFRGIIGPEANDLKEISLLNRALRWEEWGLQYEPDARHSEIIVRELGLSSGRSVGTPGVKSKLETLREGDTLDAAESTQYRALVARANYIAQDRAEIQFAVKELARGMSAPTVEHWAALKRLGRYLKGCPRIVTRFEYQDFPGRLRVSVDSDWAGCAVTRKSTSGGVVQLGNHSLKSWSSTQSVIALSSGEAEYYALVKGLCQAKGVQASLGDLGIRVGVELLTDSAAAVGIASRSGLGKTRHIAVQLLFLQSELRAGSYILSKCLGTENPADLLTKHLDEASMAACMWRMGLARRDGRSAVTPLLDGK